MEFTLICSGKETMFVESVENFINMFLMLRDVFSVDENVVKVDNDTNIKEIMENFIYEPLESSRSISQAKRHN